MLSTGLTGATPVGFRLVDVSVCRLVYRFVIVSSLVLFGARSFVSLDLGFSSLDRSDRCAIPV
jgi:hypothetical protein